MPIPSSRLAMLMKRSSVSGRCCQSFQLRRRRSTMAVSCLTVRSASSGQTSTQMLQPLQVSGFTVIDSSPPEPLARDSGTSKKGAVFASGNSASAVCTGAHSASSAARRSGS